jgi:hypothetical protein
MSLVPPMRNVACMTLFSKPGESVTQGGARSSLALGYYHAVLTGLRFRSLRSHSWRTSRISDLRHLCLT